MKMRHVLALSASLLLAACSSKVCDGDYANKMQAEFENNAVNKVYFETAIPTPGHLNVNADQKEAIKTQAAFLHKNKQVRVIVEGHCDERGTSEYNLALGERRAAAVKDGIAHAYKEVAGEDIAADRIDTISYGKDNNPYVGTEGESNASVWAKNRVAVTKVKATAGDANPCNG